jgi:hypothetical protein
MRMTADREDLCLGVGLRSDVPHIHQVLCFWKGRKRKRHRGKSALDLANLEWETFDTEAIDHHVPSYHITQNYAS